MRVLIVEDHAELRRQLHDTFSARGFAVDMAADGIEGLHLGLQQPLDLAVVDLGLPGKPGIEVISELRAEGKTYPILILTARGAWQDKVEGLEAGADDYLVKPFHPEELMARVGALLRRMAGFANPQLRFGPLCVDPRAQTVTLHDEELQLTAFEYRLLAYLVHHPGEVISKSALAEHLYQEEIERDSNVLEVLVGRLRRKLDPDGTLQPIETLRGRGYRFALSPAS